MRAFALLGCFSAACGAGAWLGWATAVVFGFASPGPPALFPGEVLAAAAAAAMGLAALAAVVRGVAGAGIGRPGRARAEGRSARNSLLFAAAFSAFAAAFADHALGRVSPLLLLPAALVALVLALGAARRSPLLSFAGVSLGVLYALVGLAVSLTRAF